MKGKILLGLAGLIFASGSANAFAVSTNTQDAFVKEQPDALQLSSVIISQDEGTLKSSYDGGNTWEPFASGETHDFYSHDEFSEWIKEQEAEISKLVEAGEWTQEKADAAIQQYYDLSASLDNGLLISKRKSDTDDQYFMSFPVTAHTQGF